MFLRPVLGVVHENNPVGIFHDSWPTALVAVQIVSTTVSIIQPEPTIDLLSSPRAQSEQSFVQGRAPSRESEHPWSVYTVALAQVPCFPAKNSPPNS